MTKKRTLTTVATTKAATSDALQKRYLLHLVKAMQIKLNL